MRRIIFASLFACVLSFLSQVAGSESAKAVATWEDGSSVISKNEIIDYRETFPCSGNEYGVEVEGYEKSERACVFGSLQETRLARFVGGNVYRYAVSFPGKTQFYEVEGLCDNTPHCVFSPVTDVVITNHYVHPNSRGASIFKNFTKSLARKYDAFRLRTYFMFQPQQSAVYTPHLKGGEPAVEAMVLSPNGEWAILEMKYFGFIRVNTQTLEARRVVAPGATYGLFYDPRYDMTITNDGKYFVATGWNAGGLSVLEITDTCGDRVELVESDAFQLGTIPCRSFPINTAEFSANLFYIQRPRFAANNQRLSVTAFYRTGKAERIVVGIKGTSSEEKLGVLGLGDSFSSGEGELDDAFYKQGTNSLLRKCHTSTRSYHYVLADQWGMRAENVACSGARSVDILGGTAYIGQQPYLASLPVAQREAAQTQALEAFQSGIVPQINFVAREQPTVIMVGIGGNDAGLIGKLQACLNVTTCEWVENPEKKRATAKEIGNVYYSVQSVIKEIKSASPSSKVYVIGYPQMINSALNAKCDAVVGMLLNQKEREFMDESIRYLNHVLSSVAAYEKVQFVTTDTAFFQHELCGMVDSNAMNGVRGGDDIALFTALGDFKPIGAESFHPTPIGHRLMAITMYDQLGPFVAYEQCSSCISDNAIPEPSEYWTDTVSSSSTAVQREEPLLTKNTLYSKEEMRIHSPRMYFDPGSTVRITLHSEPQELGVVTVTDDGSVNAQFVVPNTVDPGYHVLHLNGTAPDGTQVDVYKTIAIVQAGGQNSSTHSEAVKQDPTGIFMNAPFEHTLSLVREEINIGYTPTYIPTVQSILKQPAHLIGQDVQSIATTSVGKAKNLLFWVGIILVALVCIVGTLLLLSRLHKVRV